jgi:hypothetical protein
MEQVLNALQMTLELWIFLSVLGVALLAEEFYNYMQRRADRQQFIINTTIDRLHK